MILSDIRVVQKHSIIKTCKLKFCSVGSNVTSSKCPFMGWVRKENPTSRLGVACLHRSWQAANPNSGGVAQEEFPRDLNTLQEFGGWESVRQSVSQTYSQEMKLFESRKFLSNQELENSMDQEEFQQMSQAICPIVLQASNLSNDNLLWERERESNMTLCHTMVSP